MPLLRREAAFPPKGARHAGSDGRRRWPRRGPALLLVAAVAVVGVGATGVADGAARVTRASHVATSTDPSICVASDVHAGRSGSQASFANALKSMACDRIVMPGDLTYDGYTSQYATFNSWYGSVKTKILPARGNHDARSALSTYTGYFGSRVTTNGQPWYSVNLGAWHLVSLDLTGSSSSSAQLTWLSKDLASNRGKPTLAFWHLPRYSTGYYGDNAASESLWKILASYGADIVLNGHTHVAQRFAVTRGIREWIDSSAGYSLHTGSGTSSVRREWIVPGPQYGVLRLVLHRTSYEWRFTNTSGQLINSGSAPVS